MYKVGDKVRIKSRGWYQANKDNKGYITEGLVFVPPMSAYCGKEAVITFIDTDGLFRIDIDDKTWWWAYSMVDLIESKALWYAVDKDGFGKLFQEKPERNEDEDEWCIKNDTYSLINPGHLSVFFPSLTWEDEPIQIEIKKV